MEKVPLAKDNGTVGKRTVWHPYKSCDIHYENLYGFLNVWFDGQGSMYETEETYNAGMWYELPKTTNRFELCEERTTTKEEVDELKKFITIKKTKIFQDVLFVDETHIFII